MAWVTWKYHTFNSKVHSDLWLFFSLILGGLEFSGLAKSEPFDICLISRHNSCHLFLVFTYEMFLQLKVIRSCSLVIPHAILFYKHLWFMIEIFSFIVSFLGLQSSFQGDLVWAISSDTIHSLVGLSELFFVLPLMNSGKLNYYCLIEWIDKLLYPCYMLW